MSIKSLPIQNFELLDYLQDERFRKVKIYIAHEGENLNNTYFSKITLAKMSGTLPYIPIVGYVERNSNNSEDFSDHRSRILISEDGVEYEYLGVPYGFIPEDPQAQLEEYNGKEWLSCIGYLWTKYEKAINIFDNTNGKKSQSMEIVILDGRFNESVGAFEITDAKFDALCVLGEDVLPGMEGSKIEFYSSDSLKEQIKEMIQEFSRKDGDELKKNTFDSEDVVKEVEKEESGVEETVLEEKEEAEVEVDTGEDVIETSDSNEHESEILDDNNVENTVLGEFEAEVENENISLSEELMVELEELREFKRNVEKKEKTQLVEKYAGKLSDEEKEHFLSELFNYTFDELEKEIVFEVYKKESTNNINKKDYNNMMFTYNQPKNEAVERYGDLGNYFQ